MKKNRSIENSFVWALVWVVLLGICAPLVSLLLMMKVGQAKLGPDVLTLVDQVNFFATSVTAVLAGVVILGALLRLNSVRRSFDAKLKEGDMQHQKACAHILHLLALMDRPCERDDRVFIFPSQWEAQRGLGFLAREVAGATDFSLDIYDQTRDSDSPEFQAAERTVKRCLTDFRCARDVVRQNYAQLGCLSSWKEALDF